MLGCIYKISVGTDDFYIGSTFDFDERLKRHINDSLSSKQKLYKAIRDNNCDFNMEKLHDYKCETTTQLRIEERRVYDELKPTLNMNRPHTTDEEKRIYQAEYCKNYHQNNKETINLRHKQYIIQNAEFYKNYYKLNKEQLRLKQTKYEKANGFQVVCECGSSVKKINLKRHQKLPKHINLMKIKTECLSV